jgi:hypothetical protein
MKKWFILAVTLLSSIGIGLKECHDASERGPVFVYNSYKVSCSKSVTCDRTTYDAVKDGIDAVIKRYPDFKPNNVDLWIVPHPIKNSFGEANAQTVPDENRIYIGKMDPRSISSLVVHESRHLILWRATGDADPFHKDTGWPEADRWP